MDAIQTAATPTAQTEVVFESQGEEAGFCSLWHCNSWAARPACRPPQRSATEPRELRHWSVPGPFNSSSRFQGRWGHPSGKIDNTVHHIMICYICVKNGALSECSAFTCIGFLVYLLNSA